MGGRQAKAIRSGIYDQHTTIPLSSLPSIHHSLERHSRHFLNLLNGILITRISFIPIDQSDQFRELRRINLRPSSNQWEAHQNISSCQVFTTQPLSTIRRSLKLLLQEAEVGVVVPVEELVFYTASDCAGDGLDKEWNWSTLDFCVELSVYYGRRMGKMNTHDP